MSHSQTLFRRIAALGRSAFGVVTAGAVWGAQCRAAGAEWRQPAWPSDPQWRDAPSDGGERMQFLNQLLAFLQQGITAIFTFIRSIYGWSVAQIRGVPWDNLSALPIWKIVLLILLAGVIIYLLYQAIKELIEAGQKALAAFATLLSVFIQTLLPVLMAGVAAAVGAWIVNNVQL
jgi:hypothetical protein